MRRPAGGGGGPQTHVGYRHKRGGSTAEDGNLAVEAGEGAESGSRAGEGGGAGAGAGEGAGAGPGASEMPGATARPSAITTGLDDRYPSSLSALSSPRPMAARWRLRHCSVADASLACRFLAENRVIASTWLRWTVNVRTQLPLPTDSSSALLQAHEAETETMRRTKDRGR